MNIVSAVSNLQKAHDYYKQQAEEAREIIKQLIEGPGEIEYIHPLDLSEMLNSITVGDDITDVYKTGGPDVDTEIVTLAKTSKEYKQSVLMPVRSKIFK